MDQTTGNNNGHGDVATGNAGTGNEPSPIRRQLAMNFTPRNQGAAPSVGADGLPVSPVVSPGSATADNSNALRTKRRTAKGQFTRAETRVKNALEMDADSWTLEQRYKELKERWDKVQDVHDEYVECLTDVDEIDAAQGWIEDLLDKFDLLELKVGKKVQDSNRAKTAQASQSSERSKSQERTYRRSESILKVQKIKPKVFKGDPRKYPDFKEFFTSHIEIQCAPSEKCLILRECLSEEISDEVANVGDNYLKMWQRLDEKYGNVDKLVDTILDDIKKLSYAGKSNTEVIEMINIVEKAKRDLECLGHEQKLCNRTTISIIEGCLTEEMMSEWVKEMTKGTCTSGQKFFKLLEFLRDWRKRLEYRSASIRKDFVAEKSGASLHAKGEQPRDRKQKPDQRRCWLHNVDGNAGAHPIWSCRLFLSKPVAERKDLVQVNQACQRCLNIGCDGAKDVKLCYRKFKCKHSGCNSETHNELLHSTDGTVLHADGSKNDAILPIQSL